MSEKRYKEAEAAEEMVLGKRVKEKKKKKGKGPESAGEAAKLRSLLEDKEKEVLANKDLYLRARADLENYKVRAAKERTEYIQHANDKVIGEFLNILDNMERALEHSDSSDDVDSLADGVKHIHDNMISILATLGLKPVEAVGRAFDPNIHEAISHEEDSESEPGTVIREFKKGYYLHDRLLRPATVSVSKAPEVSDG
ncbi:MAG: nucleotide exchange factor GrpE [Thermodesulfobacteriota bacterium]